MDRRNQLIFNCIAGFLMLIVIVTSILLVKEMGFIGSSREVRDPVRMGTADSPSTSEKWQEGNVLYKGKAYRYNPNVRAYLFMGVDNSGEIDEVDYTITGGQSDAMFLMVMDGSKKKASIIGINRNTMTDVDLYYADLTYAYTEQQQICLQYGYGDGATFSCQLAEETVSQLFYDIPISGYLALNMDGMGRLNDALGGVTVEVLDDIEMGDVSLKKGETVTLSGEEAYAYNRYRDCNVFASADGRLRRQQQYLVNMLSRLANLGKGDISIVDVQDAISDYMVSSIDMQQLAEDAAEYQFDSSQMYSVPGETVMGEKYEEFYVDEAAFYEMILSIFYEEVKQ